MRLFAILLVLAACDSPAPAMRGAERDEVQRNGRRYIVYHTADSVEVIRLGYARRGSIRRSGPRWRT